MDIVGGLAAITQSLNIAKQIKEFEKQFDDAAFKLKIAELYSALADAKMALADSKEVLDGKDAEIARLLEILKRKDDLVQSRGQFYAKRTTGGPAGHPACPVCLEKDGRIFFMTTLWEKGRPEQCPSCKTKIDATVYTPDEPSVKKGEAK